MTKRDDQRAAHKEEMEHRRRKLLAKPETQRLFTQIREEPTGLMLEVTGMGISVGFQGLTVATVNKILDLLKREREDEAAEEQMESEIHGGIGG